MGGGFVADHVVPTFSRLTLIAGIVGLRWPGEGAVSRRPGPVGRGGRRVSARACAVPASSCLWRGQNRSRIRGQGGGQHLARAGLELFSEFRRVIRGGWLSKSTPSSIACGCARAADIHHNGDIDPHQAPNPGGCCGHAAITRSGTSSTGRTLRGSNAGANHWADPCETPLFAAGDVSATARNGTAAFEVAVLCGGRTCLRSSARFWPWIRQGQAQAAVSETQWLDRKSRSSFAPERHVALGGARTAPTASRAQGELFQFIDLVA